MLCAQEEEFVHLDPVDLVKTSLRTYLGMDLEDAARYILETVRYTAPNVLSAAILKLDDTEQSFLDDLLDRCDQIVEGIEEFD